MPDLSKLEQQALNTLYKNELKYSKQIQQALLDALTSIYGEMKKIYDKYAINGKLTKVEMTKYNKYSTMETQILKTLDPALKANIKSIKKLLPEQFNQSFFQYAWAIDNATGLRLSWGTINQKILIQAANTFNIEDIKNLELIEAIKKYVPEARMVIRSALLKNLSQGKSFDQMAKDLRQAVEKKIYWKALRIARTEGMRAINTGQFYAYEKARENGVNGIDVWSATKDPRTRDTHGRADGQKRGEIIEGVFSVGGEKALYPHDPNLSAGEAVNCRCTLRMEIEGYSPQLMRTREEGILPYQNYMEYTKEYHPDWLK